MKARSLTDTPRGSVISRRESQHRKAEDPICCSLLSGEITTSSRLVFPFTKLCRHPGKVFSTEEIYRQVWNDEAVSDNAIAVHVRHIREKIEINPKEPKYLKVVWGVGYKIEKQA